MAEHQGVRGELTVERLIEEERRVVLSTVRAFGAVRKLVDDSGQWRRSSEEW